jgi:methionyl-tRNA synthetase
MPTRRYITTAIDYPNAAPHMGHVLEKVLADVCARWFRLQGEDVRFQIGTDEHGIKIQQTADKEGLKPKELVDRNVALFEDLYGRLHLSYDKFIRTSNQKEHWPTVQELWKKLQSAGVLEKRTYTGLYCTGCERFLTKKDLVDGQCPIHLRAPEEVKEENWFFLLSKETSWLKELLTKEGGYKIVPQSRAHETLNLLDGGLEDVSFSRPVSSLAWGIPVPGDEGQTMYVWCDALTNYISGLGYFTDHEERQYWDDAEVTHVIGKDIARFHALIWPAMLKYAGVKTPNRLLIHGFLTSEGQKMSKSLGNVVHPNDVLEKYGVDALRFYLSHEIPVGNDGDFSWKRFGELYDAKLRNQLGNLLNRVLILMKKNEIHIPAEIPHPSNLNVLVEETWKKYQAAFEKFELSDAIQSALFIVQTCNELMQTHEVWKHEKKAEFLAEFCEALRHVSLLLLPFIPETAQKIAQQLNTPEAAHMLEKTFVITSELKKWGGANDWKVVGEPSILFAPIEEKK